jgi:aerobic carbon-monoxide dehydrogenase large subunit
VSAGRFVGQSVQRVEDPRLLTGRGRYVADLVLPRAVHAVFVRSPYPHATVAAVDVAEAMRLDGVVAVLTASELAPVSRPLRFPGHDASFTALAGSRV